MAQPAKRITVSSVNWAKLAEKLTPEQQNELDRLKQQNSTYHTEVLQYEANPPKIDWAALKKQMPEQSATLDALQKQWEQMKIPYGTVPDTLNKEIDKWIQYNQSRVKFHEQRTKDGLENVKKIEAKWAKAPPVEQMYKHFHGVHFFPHEFGYGEKHGYADWRVYHDDGEWRYIDLVNKGTNADEVSMWRRRFHDYYHYPKTGNAGRWHGWGVGDGSSQLKPPAHWPEPLTELGRQYVKKLKEEKRQHELEHGKPSLLEQLQSRHH